MSRIVELTWDSNFFNKKIGKVVIQDVADFKSDLFLEEAKAYDLVYVFSGKTLFKEIISSANLELMDTILTMSMSFDKDKYLNEEYSFYEELEQNDLDNVYKIAEQTSVVSRFHHEKLVGSELAKKLYKEWINNTLNKSFSDGLFLEKKNNKVVGLHSLRVDALNKICFFTLTGVDSNCKGGGIGRKLWSQSFGYLANKTNVELIKSPFSLNNLPSFNFHLKMGFNKIEEIKYIYHFRNE